MRGPAFLRLRRACPRGGRSKCGGGGGRTGEFGLVGTGESDLVSVVTVWSAGRLLEGEENGENECSLRSEMKGGRLL